jgi:N-acetylmuramoyl-L-alanine amidase
MGGYSFRHYGVRRWRLSSPPVIVEHYTDGTTWRGAWNHFASNARHNGELPGTCTHFLIDTDGAIYQLVALDVRCRHAVGMNHVSIGIEHVGTSDRMVLSNDEQMASSLALTTWLMARFDISVGNVVGHHETLESPYRFELYRDWKCLAHADFPRWAMKEYRTRLREVLAAAGVPHGPGPVWVDHGC